MRGIANADINPMRQVFASPARNGGAASGCKVAEQDLYPVWLAGLKTTPLGSGGWREPVHYPLYHLTVKSQTSSQGRILNSHYPRVGL